MNKIIIGKALGILFMASVLFACICVTGCGKQDFSLTAAEDGSSMTVNTENADKDMFAMSGSLTVKEGQKVVMEPAFEGGGEIGIKLIDVIGEPGQDAEAEELEEAIEGGEPALDVKVGGDKKVEYDVPPGDYYVSATALSKGLTGTLVISVK